MKSLWIAIGLALAGCQAAASAQAQPALALQAGATKVDITPAEGALQHGDVIRDRLYARAIVVSNGVTCAVIMSLDQGGVAPDAFTSGVTRAAEATGCPAQNFLVSATHTHSYNTNGLPATGLPSPEQIGDAIVAAAIQAKEQLRPARIGFGTTQLHLNTNRDLFDGTSWYQGTNREGPSDKTLAVVEFLDELGIPIAVYMNYAMHPINFYLSGQLGGDFPGEASRYLERRYPGSVALFSQGASGDQNPLLIRPMLALSGIRTNMPDAKNKSILAEDQWRVWADMENAFAYQRGNVVQPLPAAEQAEYDAALAELNDVTKAMGVLIAESAIDVMRNLTPVTWTEGEIASGQADIRCPGRVRLDQSAWQGVLPPYEDGPDAEVSVGLLQIAGVHIGWINAEVYSQIGMRMKREAASNQYMVVTIANRRGTSGYIGSNEAGSHLTFQIIGSRLKPGCAEDAIVGTSNDLFRAINP